MRKLAIIGGSGLSEFEGLDILESRTVSTPFGTPSSDVLIGLLQGKTVLFLPRHGKAHTIAPHKVNYRANIHALQQLGVTDIIAVAAVGGIALELTPGMLCVPDQIIDYTYGREQSFFSDDFSADRHIDFTTPYDETLRQALIQAAKQNDCAIVASGTYGATQGPRLETAAEIQRMAKDGCTLVGMTGMPEACLAREAGIAYATLALVANQAAGIASSAITMTEIASTLNAGMTQVKTILATLIAQ